jgi:hypothetical protein
VLALLIPSVASAKGLCPRGRFQLEGASGRDAAVLGSATLLLDKGTIDLEGVCPTINGERPYFYGQWPFRTRFRVARCEPSLTRGRMRLLLDYRNDCQTLTGTFRTRHGRTRFAGHRLPTCGNEVVEDGETCDDGNVDGGDCCDATCAIEPGCSGSCDRSADCHPAAVCIRESPSPGAACSATEGRCQYLSPAQRGTSCPSKRLPTDAVCGCDGENYPTYCDAWAAGVTVRAPGRCPCQEASGLTCPDGYWCDAEAPSYPCNDAHAQTLQGVCVRFGASCDGADPYPSCGCDGITYPDDCAREQAGVHRYTIGACPAP